MTTWMICPRCKQSMFLCKGHTAETRSETKEYPRIVGTRDIEVFDEETLQFMRAWQVPTSKDGTLQFIPHERMAGYLTDFFMHLYRDFQPVVEIPPEIPVPEGHELLPFQVEGIYAMLKMYRNGTNILLADEMGLGKTIEVLSLVNLVKPKRVLVVCPNSLKLNWKREAAEWLVDKYQTEIAGTGLCTFSPFTIINYEALRLWGPALAATPWDMVVIDEAHYVKNPSTARAKATFALNPSCKIMLTGTPIVNYPYEIFPLWHYLDPVGSGTIQTFERNYAIRGSRFSRNLRHMQQKLRDTIMIRRLKKDVLKDLPKKRRQVIEFASDEFADLLAEEKKIWGAKDNNYNTVDAVNELMKIITEAKDGGSEGDFASIIDGLKYNKRYYFQEIARIRHKVALAKVPLVIEHLDTVLDYIPGIAPLNGDAEKIVVFGHHRDVLEQIHEHFGGDDGGVSVLVMGGEDIYTREAKKDRFQTDPKCRVFVAGMAVTKEGMNLTAAHHIVFAEMDWVPGTLTQAEDRCHRIGQDEKVLIQHLVLENSLDAYMAKTVINKQRQIDKALN